MYTVKDAALLALDAVYVDPSDLAGSQARLLNFVNQLAVEARGAAANATTVLFGGNVGGVRSSEISALPVNPTAK